MKKLLLSLAGLAMAFAANAVDYYLIGGFNSWTLKQSNCKFTDQGDGTYVLDYKGTLTTGFKINDGTWGATYNYGAQNNAKLTVGQVYTVWANSNSGNIETADGSSISDPHLVFNPSANTLLITGQSQQAETVYGIHSSWTDSNWSTSNMTESNGKWVLANQTVPAGAFGIKAMDKATGSQTGWISADGDGVVVLDTPMACKLEGTNFSNAAGTYTFTFDPTAMTLTVTGTQTGETPKPDTYGDWWVNIGGSFNSDDYFNGGKQPVDGIATFENLGIGTSSFKVKVWDGSNDLYYISDGSAIPAGEWTQLYLDESDGAPITIAGATENEVYNVEFNVTNNQIKVTAVGGGNEGDVPENVYLIGDIVDNVWNISNPLAMTNKGEGIFTIENVKFQNGAEGATMGYFALTTIKSSDWNVVNANRFGPAVQDTEAVEGENKVDGKGDLAWSIAAGTYNFTFDYNNMTLNVEKVSGDTPIEPEPDPELPAKLYLIGTVNNLTWDAPVNGIEAECKDGVYTWTNITVKDEYQGNGYFSFATKVGGGWDDVVNTGVRYGAEEKDFELTVGMTGAVVSYSPGQNSDTPSWMVEAGLYDITVNLNAMTISLKTSTTDGVAGLEADEAEAVYYNLQGQKVANPDHGIFIRVAGGKAVKVVR